MILHLDLDCFFVSAHRTIDKSLFNIPVAVGGRSNLNIFNKQKQKRFISNNKGAFVSSILSETKENDEEYFIDENGRIRGIITTSSYEARDYGIKTAMSVNEALCLCPKLKMVAPQYPLYHDLSYKLGEFLKSKAPLVEQASIDEYFVDVSGYIKDDEVEVFARNLKDEIMYRFKLPISIGIAQSKYISKLATNEAKPDGIKLVNKNDLDSFIKDMPINKFPGIGKGYSKKLRGYGISTLGDIKRKKELLYSWKKSGIQLYNRICGINDFTLEKPKDSQSIGIGRTFDPIFSREEIKRRLIILARYLAYLVHKREVNPQNFYLKIQYEFNIESKVNISLNRIFSEDLFKEKILELFLKNDVHPSHNIVQLNLAVSSFMENKMDAYNLFEYEKDLKLQKLNTFMNELRDKFGVDIIKRAKEL